MYYYLLYPSFALSIVPIMFFNLFRCWFGGSVVGCIQFPTLYSSRRFYFMLRLFDYGRRFYFILRLFDYGMYYFYYTRFVLLYPLFDNVFNLSVMIWWIYGGVVSHLLLLYSSRRFYLFYLILFIPISSWSIHCSDNMFFYLFRCWVGGCGGLFFFKFPTYSSRRFILILFYYVFFFLLTPVCFSFNPHMSQPNLALAEFWSNSGSLGRVPVLGRNETHMGLSRFRRKLKSPPETIMGLAPGSSILMILDLCFTLWRFILPQLTLDTCFTCAFILPQLTLDYLRWCVVVRILLSEYH